MLLVDFHIRSLCESGMVSPFDPELLNPASLDVRLGSLLLVERVGCSELAPLDISRFDAETPFMLPAGAFVLAETMETFALPEFVCAQFVLKSSRAREGIDHHQAGWCDCGWGLKQRSVLTMELKNNRQHWPVAIWPGMKIGQMKFIKLDERPVRSYAETGRYNGDLGVTGSKGHV
jgi:dCTP deaminase